jgi:hypothetical protein
VPSACRDGFGMGRVTVWANQAGQHIILRNDVLIGTKGLGGDLASANASVAIGAISARSARSGQRTMYVRNGENGTDTLQMQCVVSSVGHESLTIVEKLVATRHLRETCTHSVATISNDYWVDAAGSVRNSGNGRAQKLAI